MQERIGRIVASHDVVLFMKGTRQVPRCGFSATVVDILDEFLEEYETVDVLAGPAIREGVEEYADRPTIPRLHVRGKFVGGSDIGAQTRESGELEQVLGTGPPPFRTPEVAVTEAAVEALAKHRDGPGKPVVRLEIARRFQNELYFDEPRADDLVLDSDTFTVLVDRSTARRADGLVSDLVRGAREAGFRIDNPNEPPRVQQLEPARLDEWLKGGEPLHLFDVRTPEERATAPMEGSILLDAGAQARLEALDRDETVVLDCHHGFRSQAAAAHVRRMGFRHAHDLAGGIDAWSREVDPSVPRY